MNNLSIRNATFSPVISLQGLAVPYDKVASSLSKDGAPYIEIIKPGALRDSLRSQDEVVFLLDHDYNQKIGSTKTNGRLIDKEDGLYFELSIDTDSSIGRTAISEVFEKNKRQCSIGFEIVVAEWGQLIIGDISFGVPIRTISQLKLSEISIVSNPVYRETYIEKIS